MPYEHEVLALCLVFLVVLPSEVGWVNSGFVFERMTIPHSANEAIIISINNSYDTNSWQRMTTIKARILSDVWNDRAVARVKICCIKFAQRVVLAQTSTAGSETRVSSVVSIYLAFLAKRLAVKYWYCHFRSVGASSFR